MGRYNRDDYEDLDEYEEEGEEQEEEGVGDEEEEAPQLTEEESEYLELRQRLKESFRQQMRKESGSALANTQEKKKKLPYDNYGSFFGPSQPVIAQRVIQESKSLLENQHLEAKVSKPHHDKNKSFALSTAGSKTQSQAHRPKVVNELKMKVQKLKDTRDYSFLLSDDAELPAPTKDPAPRHVSVPNSEARSAQVPPKSEQSINKTVRQVPNGREVRKPVSTGSQIHPKAGFHKVTSASKPILTSSELKRQFGSNTGSGPGRPIGPKDLPFKKPAATTEKRAPAATTEKRAPAAVAKSSPLSAQKPPTSKMQSSASKQPSTPKQCTDKKKEFQDHRKGKMLPKQPLSSSKPQINKPPAKILPRATLQENRPKKKPVRRYSDDEDDDEGGRAISMIREMFGYNPNKYSGRNFDDDRGMEANFNDILLEEKRSARIARKEDEEELRIIEEEERQEQLRKEAKKRKLSQR